MKAGDITLLTLQILGTLGILFIAFMFMIQQEPIDSEDLGDGPWERVSNPLFINYIMNILLGAMVAIYFMNLLLPERKYEKEEVEGK